MSESSTKPYLIRALYEWCCDNGLTPYIAVAVDAHTRVPLDYVRDGQIVLNLAPVATHRLELGNDYIQFEARFGGVAREVAIPVGNISSIYAKENGHGMAFEVTPLPEGAQPQATPDEPVKATTPLSVVPSAKDDDDDEPTPPPASVTSINARSRLKRIK